MFSCVVREKRELPTKKKKKKGEDEKLGEGFLCASKMWEIIITSGSKSSLFTQVVGPRIKNWVRVFFVPQKCEKLL
jgi:hypothetical protein